MRWEDLNDAWHGDFSPKILIQLTLLFNTAEIYVRFPLPHDQFWFCVKKFVSKRFLLDRFHDIQIIEIGKFC